MPGDDAPSLTALLREFGGLWVITRTPRGFTAHRRPLPAPPVVLAAATMPAPRELLEHGRHTSTLAELMRDYDAEWDIERVDPGSTWVAVSRDGALPRVIAAGDLDNLRTRLSSM